MVRKKARRKEVKVMKNVGFVYLTKLSVGEAFSGVKCIFVWNSQLVMKSESITISA